MRSRAALVTTHHHVTSHHTEAGMAGPDDLTARLPPQNLEAERSVLGSMLLSNDAIDEVAAFLKGAHFYHDAHQRIYATICEMRDSGRSAIDPVTVAAELQGKQI